MREGADALLSETQYQRRYLRSVDIRFAGQAFELSVPFGEGFEEFDLDGLKDAFLKLYRARYGYTSSDPIECVNWRLVAMGIVPKVSLEKKVHEGKTGVEHAAKGTRVVRFPDWRKQWKLLFTIGTDWRGETLSLAPQSWKSASPPAS